MNALPAYFIGLITPVFLFACYGGSLIWDAARRDRRYARAWHKFVAEWDAMSDEAKELFSRSRRSEFVKYQSERDRYFAKRWNNGFTKEV